MKTLSTLAFAFLAATTPVAAQSIDNLAQATLRPGWRTDAGEHIAGLEIALQPGWITYWRAPGDTGIPPQFSFSGSAGIESVTPHWPTPQVIDYGGMRSIGYHDYVVFPLVISADPDAAQLTLQGQIEIGVCKDICIPVTLDFAGILPAVGGSDGAIAGALDARAISAAAGGVTDVTCTVTPLDDGLRVTAAITLPPRQGNEYVVIEAGDPSVWVSQAQVMRDGPVLNATVDMLHLAGGAFMLDRSALRMTVFGSERAVDIQGCAAG